MGNPKAFLTIDRKEAGYRPLNERKFDFGEVEQTLNTEDRKLQASRCMDCGIPFCHWLCPLGNIIPEWQDLLYRGQWREASDLLHKTDDFPEFTGRVCPALCEKSCVLNIPHTPVTIRENEAAIVEHAFTEGYIKPNPPKVRTGKKVAVIGSGPAGLTVAVRLNRQGHQVTVFEKDAAIGGLLRFGIPDFKLSKNVIDRRLDILRAEGIDFVCNKAIGKDISSAEVLSAFDAVCVAIGAGQPRDLKAPGRELKGIHFAMDFLTLQNKLLRGDGVEDVITAKGKHVLVIGGGDTGSDCVGTSIRQGALSVTQIEILPKPPEGDNPATPWPYFPNILKTSSSHEEGCTRRWSLNTRQFVGNNDAVSGVEVIGVEWAKDDSGKMIMKESGKPEVIQAELVLLSMGFVHPVHAGLVTDLKLGLNARGNVEVNATKQTSVAEVFAAGDAASGASLVVSAMAHARSVAEAIDVYLRRK